MQFRLLCISSSFCVCEWIYSLDLAVLGGKLCKTSRGFLVLEISGMNKKLTKHSAS